MNIETKELFNIQDKPLITYFHNEEPIDLDMIRLMGVNIKVNDSPIGYFGTGLKFAIATLLREGAKISLMIDNKHYEFTKRVQALRNTTIERIYMNDEALPFTTQLGKNWVIWQAFRELYSNTLDENGIITDLSADISDKPLGTTFIIEHDQFHDAFENRDEIFLNSHPDRQIRPIFTYRNGGKDILEIYSGISQSAFYRGVKAHILQAGFSEGQYYGFTYNLLEKSDLTEDRTLKNSFDLEYYIRCAISSGQNRRFTEKVILDKKSQEFYLDPIEHAVTEEFVSIVMKHRDNINLNIKARFILESRLNQQNSFESRHLTSSEKDQVLQALNKLAHTDIALTLDEIEVESNPNKDRDEQNIWAFYYSKSGQIILTQKIFVPSNEKMLACALYEEWTHKSKQVNDRSLGIQNAYLDQIISLAEKLSKGNQEI